MRESDLYRRRSPEVLLQYMEQLKRGRFAILVAAASGAGKTTELLNEGLAKAKQGLKVVWATTPPSQEGEASALRVVPPYRWQLDEQQMEDICVKDIVALMPDVVLVDGLAQPNRVGAERVNRLEDVRCLIQNGISVIATMNAYEDERISKQARKIAGVDTRWIIPGEVLKEADEVRLLDVTAEALLERRKHESDIEGHTGKPRSHRSNGALTERSRMMLLRELALRTIADNVNGELEQHRHELGLEGPSGATERIVVLAQYGWNGSIHIRRGDQIAKRLNSELSIVTFVMDNKELTPVQASFRRSIRKLADKLGASLTELSTSSVRGIPKRMARFAWEEGMSRIVLGHSRQTRWQEWFNGSIAVGLMKRLTRADLYFVADRAVDEGERVLPARAEPAERKQPFKRQSSAEIAEKAMKLRRGRFKIIIGAAPGVGKTYKMLREGIRLQEQGVDVVIGLLETHGRSETAAQAGSLPLIPRKLVLYNGRELEEMDTEAILARKPELVLVDELAHTNVPGSIRAKRYEDVQILLEAGISVMTTVNIQHLESLNDAVEQLTGVKVRETVPDGILRNADEMELIDVSPQTIQERLQSGLIYAMDKVPQALNHFFRISNLIGLRELALREVADDVDERLESWERRAQMRGPWRREEVIFVCVEPNSSAERLIRHGFRIAHRLKAQLHIVCIPFKRQGSIDSQRITAITRLIERLGGTFYLHSEVSRRAWAAEIVHQADAARATQLIVGMPAKRQRWRELGRMKRLMRIARHMDMLILTDVESVKSW
ncbi:histidine kinase [Paenibacillus marinisediminis]